MRGNRQLTYPMKLCNKLIKQNAEQRFSPSIEKC